jgi:hypothetical protein
VRECACVPPATWSERRPVFHLVPAKRLVAVSSSSRWFDSPVREVGVIPSARVASGPGLTVPDHMHLDDRARPCGHQADEGDRMHSTCNPWSLAL